MERRTYQLREHYLVEIDDTKPFGSNGTSTRTYTWEVFIAVKLNPNSDHVYKGKAVEPRDLKREIPWTIIEDSSDKPLDVMIRMIENKIKI